MFITENIEKKKRVDNLKKNLIGKGIYVAIETAKYYINESKLSADLSRYYREKVTDANNYIFTEYLKLHIFELLNYLFPKIDEEIFKGLNNDGKQFFKMKFETFLLKKGFPFRQSEHITESQIEGKFKLPEINFYLAKYEGIYLEFNYESVTLNSNKSKIFMEEINKIKIKFNNLIGNINKTKNKIFEINKIQKLKNSKINSIFIEANNNSIFSPFNYININNNNNNNEEENLENNHPEKNININSNSEFTTNPTEDIIFIKNNNGYEFIDVPNLNIHDCEDYCSDNSNNCDSNDYNSNINYNNELFFEENLWY